MRVQLSVGCYDDIPRPADAHIVRVQLSVGCNDDIPRHSDVVVVTVQLSVGCYDDNISRPADAVVMRV